ncbi:MAG: acetyltransferase [Bacteroidetes bacterium]|nr:acetyltransferase [Bacteroidota bacterium]
MINLWIYGAGGFGREVLWLTQSVSHLISVSGFIDDNAEITTCDDYPVHTMYSEDMYCVIAIANTVIRKQIHSKLKSANYINVIHPDSTLGNKNVIGSGCIICKGVTGTTGIHVGNQAIINLNATIGHDVVIDDFVSIMPGVHISGNVKIGEGVLIGTGAVILPGITIGKWSKIGAGAVITKDVPDNAVVVGVPGRVVRKDDDTK